jgi:glucose-1-phosphate adenylyltransferase
MDYRDVIRQHIEKKSAITIATIPVSRSAASDFGIMHTDPERRIIRFEEKPKEAALLDELKIPPPLLAELDKDQAEELYQASMGIYVFNRDVLVHVLDNDCVDFGKHIIPASIRELAVHAYIFQGYWEDIGTIRAFFDANLNLTDPVPEYSFFDSTSPVYTHARFLPASKINGATIKHAIISDGCKIADAHIERSVIGIRSYIGSGTTIRNSIVMGADFYDADMAAKEKAGDVPYGIGKSCVIEHTIVDKNARIGDGSAISPEGKPSTMDGENFYIRDGIVIIPKNAVLPPGTRI